MSTRANVLIKDAYSELWMYHHSDGYPTGMKDTLTQFIDWVNRGLIRGNASQSAGWLIILGIQENIEHMQSFQESMGDLLNKDVKINLEELAIKDYIPTGGVSGWKVGAYEPTNEQHGDIEWLYTLDLQKKTLTVQEIYSKEEHLIHFSMIEEADWERLENLGNDDEKVVF